MSVVQTAFVNESVGATISFWFFVARRACPARKRSRKRTPAPPWDGEPRGLTIEMIADEILLCFDPDNSRSDCSTLAKSVAE
jgi:hypothetical protein